MSKLNLQEIGPENWRVELSVRTDQRNFVSDKYKVLARAYAYRKFRSKVYMIYEGNFPIGMVMYYDDEELKAYNLSQFFIDYRYQGKGYGEEALRLVLDDMKQDGKYSKLVLCFIEDDFAARRLYEKIGFKLNGISDGNEIGMELLF